MYRNKFVLSLVGVSVAGAALGAYFLYRKLTAKYDDDGEIIPKSNKELIKYLKHKRHITQKEVEWVMLKVNRANYVPNSPTPYADQAQPIGFNATISAPHMHAISLEVLAEVIQPGAKVLDVGSGSGYMTACFAMLVGPNGRVYAIDHVKELVEMSLKNIQKDNPQLLHRITTKVGDGMLGWPEHAPYDVIYVGAAAEKMPQALLDQLKPGGRLLIPIGPATGFHNLVLVDLKDGRFVVQQLGLVRFTPLTSLAEQLSNDSEGARTKVTNLGTQGKVLVLPHVVPAPDTSPKDLQLLRAVATPRGTHVVVEPDTGGGGGILPSTATVAAKTETQTTNVNAGPTLASTDHDNRGDKSHQVVETKNDKS